MGYANYMYHWTKNDKYTNYRQFFQNIFSMQYYIYTDAICPSNNAYFEADKGTGNNPKK